MVDMYFQGKSVIGSSNTGGGRVSSCMAYPGPSRPCGPVQQLGT
jgi:hypothetical protein